jgi:NDP-sugar pyrophosphorylase family protein/aminoglycoside/choline kinase family phosphotransferase
MKPAKIRTAFVLGAGLGTRLRPLTQNCPKPLLPVGGRPLITFAMDHCLSIGVKRFIVNTHHCAAAYDETFPDGNWRGRPILFRHEPVLLDTAGGLKNIEDLLAETEDDEAILVYNGDILSDLPLSRLLAAHAAAGREVTIALRSNGPLRNVCLDARGEICDFRDLLGNSGVRRCLFTGISVVERRFLRRLTPGKVESTIPVFAAMIREAPGSVASVVIDEGSWEDIGDIPAYERIEAGEAISRSRLETADSSTRPQTIAPGDAAVAPTATDGEREDAANPTNTVIPALPRGIPAVAGADEDSFIRRTLGLAAGTQVELAQVGKGGSDRDYFRVTAAGGRPAILMRYGRMYEENDLFAAIASFLREIGVTVPAIYGHDPERRLILMEDLGDTDLYALGDAPWEVRRGLYEKTLALAARMLSFSPDRLPAELRLMPGFDANLYRWERDYFREHCVRNVCRITPGAAEDEALEEELSALAVRLLSTPPVLVHRDLQSQNVMILDSEPVLIDFQGMRPGSPFYDLGSLLCDPYVSFPEGERDELLRYCHGLTVSSYPWKTFRELFLLASAQRLMQALGAYGFLGLKREKPHFLNHIRPALENLVSVTAETGSLPRLHALARRCREALFFSA